MQFVAYDMEVECVLLSICQDVEKAVSVVLVWENAAAFLWSDVC
jgi:hypothetical protein